MPDGRRHPYISLDTIDYRESQEDLNLDDENHDEMQKLRHRYEGNKGLEWPRLASIRRLISSSSRGKLTLASIAMVAILLMTLDESQRFLSSLWQSPSISSDNFASINKVAWAYQDDNHPMSNRECKDFRMRLSQRLTIKSHCEVNHIKPGLGEEDLFSTLPAHTYSDRFSPYTDTALGLTYRDIENENDTNKIDHDLLLGPIKPKGLSKEDWSLYLKDRNLLINTRIRKDEMSNIPNWKRLSDGCGSGGTWKVLKPKKKRTVVVIRYYEGFVMLKGPQTLSLQSEDQVLDMRAMLSETVINHPQDGRSVRILVEVKKTIGALMSKKLQEEILQPLMPREFWNLVEFWSVESAKLFVPGVKGPESYKTRKDCILATQLFSHLHPEYDYLYNWEADLRFLGDYHDFFSIIEDYARKEPLSLGLEKYKKFYVKGSDSSQMLWHKDDHVELGRGKEADLITFDPFLDVQGSGWIHTKDIYNYGPQTPLLTSIVSLVRLSKELARSMNLATVLRGKSMQCEAWPATVVLHSHLPPSKEQTFDADLAEMLKEDLPFKAVYVPNPVYFNRPFTPEEVNKAVNDPRYLKDDRFMRESTFLWGSKYLPRMYKDWRKGYRTDACRAPSLVHPVKDVGYN